MTFYDIHTLKDTNASSKPFLINDLSYLKDDTFVPVAYQGAQRANGSGRPEEPRPFFGRGYISCDSTTLDPQKATRMCLDSVPMNSYKKDLWSIYDKSSDVNRYKSLYYSRDELPGQIQYYVNPVPEGLTTVPYFSPLFPKNTKTLGSVYIDPMNNIHYEFRRSTGSCGPPQPINCNECEIAEFRDSQEHREDMLSYIMNKRNKVEYEPVYFNFTTRYSMAKPLGAV